LKKQIRFTQMREPDHESDASAEALLGLQSLENHLCYFRMIDGSGPAKVSGGIPSYDVKGMAHPVAGISRKKFLKI